MLNIGYHESKSLGWEGLVKLALEAGGNTFAFFTRNPRSSFRDDALALSKEDKTALQNLQKALCDNNFAPIVAHAPYTANPCSEDEIKRRGAWALIQNDVDFLTKYLPTAIYNFHPGSPKSLGRDEGLRLVSLMVATILQKTPSAVLTIETMAGKGSEIGRTFSELKAIIEGAEALFGRKLEKELGVCFDTCHTWDGGYNLVEDLEGVLQEFDKTVGLNRIKAIHLNDSKNALGTRKDRHELIGEGFIGFDALLKVVQHKAFCNLPFILETPNDEVGYKKEIKALKDALLCQN